MPIEVMYDRDNNVIQEISRDVVFAEDDAGTLSDWLKELTMLEMEVSTSMRSMDRDDEKRVPAGRKLGFVRIAMRWVKMRLDELGGGNPDDPYGQKMRSLQAALEQATAALADRNAKLKAANIELTRLREERRAEKRSAATPA